jgi:hypothetical protein
LAARTVSQVDQRSKLHFEKPSAREELRDVAEGRQILVQRQAASRWDSKLTYLSENNSNSRFDVAKGLAESILDR